MALTDKLTAIADGFRTSRGTEQKYTLDEMAVLAAENVGGGAVNPTLQEKVATENGEVLPDEGYDGLSKVIVNVPNYVTVADEAELLNTTATDGTIAVITG